jgi:hypothetical protein
MGASKSRQKRLGGHQENIKIALLMHFNRHLQIHASPTIPGGDGGVGTPGGRYFQAGFFVGQFSETV